MLKAFLILSVFALASCAEVGSDGNNVSGGTQDSNEVFTLTWIPPVSFENSDVLIPANDLSEYRVYYGDSSDNVTRNFTSINVDKTSFSTQNINVSLLGPATTVYVAMTSVSNDGVESVLSEIVTFNP